MINVYDLFDADVLNILSDLELWFMAYEEHATPEQVIGRHGWRHF